ncbi:MAG TPA: hypothetical protein VOA64_02430 [Candidatus Dormibacteraeota bacterium]|nr:hypothetical protein [Candidatus Dormibacteraeota bacterium]
MPKRVLDFDAMWASDKIAACAEWAQGEYPWIYGLADANGSFELTNPRVAFSRTYAIRRNMSLERFAQIIDEFHDKGLLFIWTQDGKRYGHWTGSDKPGRLPRESRRTPRYGPIFAPPVPKDQLKAYITPYVSQCDTNPVAVRQDSVDGLGLGLGLGKGVGEKNAATARAAQPVAFHSSFFVVTQDQDLKLADTYPWIDRQQEYKKMALWIEANRTGRKVRNTLAFCQNWFNKIPCPKNGKGGLTNAERRTLNNLEASGLKFVQ